MKEFFLQMKEKAVNGFGKAVDFITTKMKMFNAEALILALVAGWFVSMVSPLGFILQAAISSVIIGGSWLYFEPKSENGKKCHFYLITVACFIALFFGMIF